MSLGGERKCPLCGRWIHTTRRGRFYRHHGAYKPGPVFDVAAALLAMSAPCKAAGKTEREARALA